MSFESKNQSDKFWLTEISLCSLFLGAVLVMVMLMLFFPDWVTRLAYWIVSTYIL